jgi:prepilin-type N-terminal cleavage/methylation domain-containing protein
MPQIIKKAFTLIELLVVIAIIGILSGMIVVGMSGVTNKANVAKGQVFSNSLRNALMTDIIGEWKFDELTTAINGTVIQDSWGGLNNGTLYTGADPAVNKVSTDCVSGKCLSFDGTDDYIDCGSGLNITSTITIESWINTNTLTLPNTYKMIFNGNASGNSYLAISTNLKAYPFLSLNIGGTQRTLSSTFTPIINTWYHIVGTYDGDKMRIYINGSLSTTSPSYVGALNMVGAKYIGKYVNVGYNFSGLMDDIRIYDVAVPISQIKQQYYIGLNSLLANGSITSKEYKEKINNIAMSDN